MKTEEKLRKEGLDVIVSKFDHVEEYLMLYGLPPSINMNSLRSKIIDSITPFVKRVLEVAPCVHKGATDDDYFSGKYDGNWRLKVIPRSGRFIPNFIVIGNEVMGKAVYSKRLGETEELCTECFKPGHYRKDCPGG